jgi:GTP:adenosylcobinamide-phosphate guanylyltransferase
MGEWTAILLAGQRPGENDFAAAYGLTAKALIPVAGEAMLSRVARTLLACPTVGRVVVLAQAPEALFTGDAAWLRDEPRIGAAAGGEGISASIAAIAGSDAAPYPLLVTTADHPLLRPEMVEAVIAGSAGSDAAFALVERKVVEQVHPETKRTWIKFSDGHYTGANLFALATPASGRAVDFWSRVERDRKKALKLLTFFGPAIFLRGLTRTISLDGAVAKASAKLGLRVKAVKLPFPEAAIDVDKPADLELAERIFAGHKKTAEA